MELSETLDILSIGAGILIFGVSVATFLLGGIGLLEVVPMFVTLFSLWIMASAALKTKEAFFTAARGFFLFAVGLALWLYFHFPLVVVVLVLTLLVGGGVLVIGLRSRAPK